MSNKNFNLILVAFLTLGGQAFAELIAYDRHREFTRINDHTMSWMNVGDGKKLLLVT